MPAFQINDDEWGALVEEPAELFKLYCGIRRVMDYRTGIAGKSRRISEQMLREVLYVAPLSGRHAPAEVTRQKVRSLLKRLEALGLTVSLGPLVLQLPLATSDGLSKTGATKEQPEQQPQEQPPEESPEANEIGASSSPDDGAATAGESPEPPRNNLPPVSGKSTSTGNARGAFAMPLEDWAPEPKTFKAFAFANSVPVTSLTPEILAAFRTYWHVRPTTEKTQAQWEQQLVSHLQYLIRQAQAGGNTYANSRTGTGTASGPGQQRRLSAVDRVEANVAAARAARGEGAGSPEPWTAGETLDHDDPDLWPQVDLSIR
ncbi:DnaT-like ssDNA-binding domain-containing protein [Pseudomonas sp. NMI1173_11]|uniref:DnaT-like ssDNA-binding domain-containing protein n=1 Tax=Pseudomonas sp. NMI1173_11 TaxID=2903145 RepID=UPI001E586D41|nr:DnaT-like ssDNA-binding domain-containing protein [Pseudomonas sp. NMI1173_11]MCE1001851.1 hypothetical protein [Pseudomonas sp. NMI1173_11]